MADRKQKKQAASNLPRDANRGQDEKNATSGHNVQKLESGVKKQSSQEKSGTANSKKKYYRQQQPDTSGHNVQKSQADAEKAFLKENSFMQEEQPGDSDRTMENEVHVRDVLVKPFCNTLFDKYLPVTSLHWC